MTRLFLIIAAIGALVVGAMQWSAEASSTGWKSYDEASFMMAQKKGKTIVVNVNADGCLACGPQAPILDELRRERASGDVLFMSVDVDEAGTFLRAHGIARQSAVLVFKGMDEVARSDAETNPARLRSVMLGAL